MIEKLKQAIALLKAVQDGTPRASGTAFLVTARHLLTAYHVVGGRVTGTTSEASTCYGDLTISFDGDGPKNLRARVVPGCFNPQDDWALVEADGVPADIQPIPFGSLEEILDGSADELQAAIPFETWGYAAVASVLTDSGIAIDGRVQDINARYKTAEALQLYSDNAAAARGAPLSGLSGAPCVVNGIAVGIIRSNLIDTRSTALQDQPGVFGGILFACPIRTPSLVSACEGILPELAITPDLPPLPRQPLPTDPFRYLKWYGSDCAAVFFGRNTKLKEIFAVIESPDAPQVTLIYGASGIGKSSLLDAGLIPRLKGNYQVRLKRRERHEDLAELLEEILIRSALDLKPDSRPIVILMDQIEEVFLRPHSDGNEEMKRFVDKALEVLGQGSRPPLKLVLGFRSEWLAEIRSRFRESGIATAEIHVERMVPREIEDVVRGIASTERLRAFYRVSVDDTLPARIADDLLSDPKSPVSPLLSIILTRLWREAKAMPAGSQTLSRSLYDEHMRSKLSLRQFLEEQITRSSENAREDESSGLINDVLFRHTTASGTAQEISWLALDGMYPHLRSDVPQNSRHLRQLVDALCESSLLYLVNRDEADGNADANERMPGTRLAHDTLANLVRNRYFASERPGQRAERVLQARVTAWSTTSADHEALDTADLEVVERGYGGMRHRTNPEQELVNASVKRRRSELRRKTALRVGAVVSSAIILVLAVAAWGFWRSARTFEDRANSVLTLAKDQRARALIDLGYLTLNRQPVTSLKLALAAAALKPDLAPFDLIQRTAMATPEWAQLPSDNPEPCAESSIMGGHFDDQATRVDSSVMNPDFHLQVRQHGNTLELWNLDSDAVLAKRTLPPGDSLLPAIVSTGKLFAIGHANGRTQHIELYPFDASTLSMPLARIEARVLALTDGGLPAFAVDANSRLVRITARGAQLVSDEEWPLAVALTVHPTGTSVLIHEQARIVWISIEGEVEVARHVVLPQWPVTASEARRAYAPHTEIGWGPRAFQFYVFESGPFSTAPWALNDPTPRDSAEPVTVDAIDARARRRTRLIETYHPEVGLSRPVFAVSPDGRMIAVTAISPNKRDSSIKILGVDWDQRVPSAAPPSSNPRWPELLRESSTTAQRAFPSAVAFSPNGQYVVVAENVNTSEFYGQGRILSWDLRPPANAQIEPVPLFVGQSASRWETQSDIPEETVGKRYAETPYTCLVGSISYGADSQRLLVTDYRGTGHLFRLRAEPPPEHEATRAPTTWLSRLKAPEVFPIGVLNRQQLVKYGDGEWTLYDFDARKQYELSQLVGGAIVDAEVVEQSHSKTTLVVAGSSLFSLRDGSILRELKLPEPVTSVQWGSWIAILFGAQHMYVYRIQDETLGEVDSGAESESLRTSLLGERASFRTFHRPRHFQSGSGWNQSTPDLYRSVAMTEAGLTGWNLHRYAEGTKYRVTQDSWTWEPGTLAGQDYYSAAWDAATETVFWNRGVYGGVTDLRQIDAHLGTEVAKYKPPEAGWPRLLMEAAAAYSSQSKTILILRYLKPAEEAASHFVVGVWSEAGGNNLSWSELGDRPFDDGIRGIHPVDGGALAYLLMADTARDAGAITMARASDGALLKTIPVSKGRYTHLHPVLSFDSTLSLVENEWALRARQDIEMRGVRYWEGLSRVSAPQADDELSGLTR